MSATKWIHEQASLSIPLQRLEVVDLQFRLRHLDA